MAASAVVVLSLVFVIPVNADAPAEGTVVEGVSVPGIVQGTTRAQIETSVGPPGNWVSNNDPPANESCRFDMKVGRPQPASQYR